jgi:carbon-monoxide dehydrogenase small subunit
MEGTQTVSTHHIELTVNGQPRVVTVSGSETLLEVLREDLQLTGTKNGCGEGDCGACTVLLNGKAVKSCLVLAVQAARGKVTTIEGLSRPDNPHPIQRAFVQAGAVQCGFCTPGMIMAAKALLDENPSPTEEEIREALSGNLCRCTGYAKIVDAVRIAAAELMEGADR